MTNTNTLKISDSHYSSLGDPTRKALVFIHAFPLSSLQWAAQMEHFSKNYFCVAIDLPGFGKAKLADNVHFSFEAYVDYFVSILDELKLQKSTWVGLSMGGYLLLRALEKIADRAEKIVLCDTKSGADGNEAKLKRWEGVQAVSKDKNAFIQAQAKALLSPKSQADNEILEHYVQMAGANSSEAIAAGLVALSTRTDTTEGLSKIRCPTLIVVGSEDKVTPPQEAQALNKAISGSQLKIIEGSGHLSNIENPQEFNRCLESFLKS